MPLNRIAAICMVLFALFVTTGVGWAASDRPGLKDFAQHAFGVQADLRERLVNDEVVYEAWRGGDYLGTAVSTWDLVRSVGYSGQPIDIWAAVDPAGAVVAAQIGVRADLDFQVAGGQLDLRAGLADQHIGQDRQRVAALHNAGHRLQDAEHFVLCCLQDDHL